VSPTQFWQDPSSIRAASDKALRDDAKIARTIVARLRHRSHGNPMTDRIILKRIAVYANHGLLAEEERMGQRFYISLDCRLDLGPAGRADDVTKTASYEKLAEIVTTISANRRFKLIEALAEAIAKEILARSPLIQSLTVRVDKPSAPIPAILDEIAIVIERHRDA
jgi:dihydroneopterin aldolase